MAYTEEQLGAALHTGAGSGQSAAEVLSAAASHGEDNVMGQVRVKRLMFMITTVTVGAATVEFTRRPTPGSATGELSMGTLIVPDATAVGTVLYKDITLVTLAPGESIELKVSSAGTSGAGYYGYDSELDPETADNQTNMLASA